MKKSDYIIIIILICISWIIGYSYFLAPEDVRIKPFIFSDKDWTIRWYIYQLSNSISNICIGFALKLFARKYDNEIIKDATTINLIIVIFALIWFVLFYDNPFFIGELWVKIITVAFIYLSIISIRWHAKRNSSISGRSTIRRAD